MEGRIKISHGVNGRHWGLDASMGQTQLQGRCRNTSDVKHQPWLSYLWPGMWHIWSSQGCPTSGSPNSWMLQLEATPSSHTVSPPIPGIASIPSPPHPVTLIPTTLHSHPNGVPTLKKNDKKGKWRLLCLHLHPKYSQATHEPLSGACFNTAGEKKKPPSNKTQFELDNTSGPLMETS